jgi:hypothetical protein
MACTRPVFPLKKTSVDREVHATAGREAGATFSARGGLATPAGGYSETRVAVPKGNAAKWLFPQEKATSETLFEGTITLVSL